MTSSIRGLERMQLSEGKSPITILGKDCFLAEKSEDQIDLPNPILSLIFYEVFQLPER